MYGYTKKMELNFSNAIAKLREELAKEGFGVLTEIDVKSTLKKKLDVDIENYIILGACNPKMAHKALQVEKEIGLLLPCNVIVYEENGDVKVSAILPTQAMSVTGNNDLNKVAVQVEKSLKRVIDRLGG
ncbi:DUF302 domain-containing protein [Nanoarchaeota archaeon]